MPGCNDEPLVCLCWRTKQMPAGGGGPWDSLRGEINWLSLMELAFSSLAPFGPHYSPPSLSLYPPPLSLLLRTPFSPLLPLFHSQAPPELPERYRPLLLAAVKGYLTRRLLRSERVAQLVRTVRVSRDRGVCVRWFFRYLMSFFDIVFLFGKVCYKSRQYFLSTISYTSFMLCFYVKSGLETGSWARAAHYLFFHSTCSQMCSSSSEAGVGELLARNGF